MTLPPTPPAQTDLPTDAENGPLPGDVTADVRARLDAVRARVEDACGKVGRRASSVTLVAVTKYASPEQTRAAVKLGLADLGENYVQNLRQRAATVNEYHDRLKQADLPVAPAVRWHLIGHLQRNKVKEVLPHVTMLHTLDSLRLAEAIEEHAPKLLGEDVRLPCLLQVNCSDEPQKSGVAVAAAVHMVEQLVTMGHIRLMGLMTMARHDATPSDAQRTFARCREVYEEVLKEGFGGPDFRHLSMGMSGDYEPAILEGATIIRLGSALFGENTIDPDPA